MANKEKPEKILKKQITLKSIEAGPNGLIPELSIDAVVQSFDNGKYNLKFLSPVKINEFEESSAWISSRVVGSPISSAKKIGIMAQSVAGEFGSGEQFLASINLK